MGMDTLRWTTPLSQPASCTFQDHSPHLLLPDVKISLNYGLSISRSTLIERFWVPVHASLYYLYDLMIVHSECVFFLFSLQQSYTYLNVNMFSDACLPQSSLQKTTSFSFLQWQFWETWFHWCFSNRFILLKIYLRIQWGTVLFISEVFHLSWL